MTITDPQPLAVALSDVLRTWQTETGQAPPLAAFCAFEHPFLDVLCHRIHCDGRHEDDGLNTWTDTPNDEERKSDA